MGWCGASEIVDVIIKEAMKAISDDEKRLEFYKAVIKKFWDADWDTTDECMGVDPVFDKWVKETEGE